MSAPSQTTLHINLLVYKTVSRSIDSSHENGIVWKLVIVSRLKASPVTGCKILKSVGLIFFDSFTSTLKSSKYAVRVLTVS